MEIAVGITIFCKENCGTGNTEEPCLEIDKAVMEAEFLILEDTAGARTFGIITLLFADTYCLVTLIALTYEIIEADAQLGNDRFRETDGCNKLETLDIGTVEVC